MTRDGVEVATMFPLVVVVSGILGAAVWMVLDRPVTRRVDRSDRASALLLAASAVALTAGLVFGLRGLF